MIERSRVRISAGVAGKFSSPGSTFCVDSYFGIRLPISATAVARKRLRSFRQKCRWQVKAKHAYTLRMSLCMKWHGCMVYTERAEMAAVSCGTSHASAVSTPLRWIFKNKNKTETRYKASHSCRTTCERNESAQESGE